MIKFGFSDIRKSTSYPFIFHCLAPACPERHLDSAQMLGHEGQSNRKEDAGAILGDVVRKFMDDMKIPDGLKALNYTKDDVPALVAGAIPQVRKSCSFFLRSWGHFWFLITLIAALVV